LSLIVSEITEVPDC